MRSDGFGRSGEALESKAQGSKAQGSKAQDEDSATGGGGREDSRSEWLRKLDEECPYQVVLPRGPGDAEIMNFLNAYVSKFDMYAEDEYAVFVRYCFSDPLDAAIFRSRFEFKSSRLRLAG
jgi:hypothetical protein